MLINESARAANNDYDNIKVNTKTSFKLWLPAADNSKFKQRILTDYEIW